MWPMFDRTYCHIDTYVRIYHLVQWFETQHKKIACPSIIFETILFCKMSPTSTVLVGFVGIVVAPWSYCALLIVPWFVTSNMVNIVLRSFSVKKVLYQDTLLWRDLCYRWLQILYIYHRSNMHLYIYACTLDQYCTGVWFSRASRIRCSCWTMNSRRFEGR